MDSPRRSPRPELDTAQELLLHHKPALTGHVSQLDSTRQHQQHPTSPSEPPPNHPFNLNFPTLDVDGSVSYITAHQTRRYPPTPPAALSSLGAKSKMDRAETASESEGSFADSQYDMLDDMSEISTDDHETASITSNNGDDGQLTPDDAGSEADPEESLISFEDETQLPTPPSTEASYVNLPTQAEDVPSLRSLSSNLRQKQKAENDLIDSYMSEDMETPRQSTMPSAQPSSWYRSKGKEVFDRPSNTQSPTIQEDGTEPRNILFVSEHDVPQFEMDKICIKIDTSMMSTDEVSASSKRVIRLPAPPSGIGLPSATAVYGRDRISATLQHCVGAEVRSPGSYKLRVMDFDGQHSSFYTIGQDAKIDLRKPNVAVFYVVNSEPEGRYSTWLDNAFDAIKTLNVPIVAILGSNLNATAKQSWFERSRGSKRQTQLYLGLMDFLHSDITSISKAEKRLSKRDIFSKTPGSKKADLKERRAADVSWFKLLSMFLVAVVPYLLMPFIRSSSAPVLDTAIRREGLSVALEKISPSIAAGAVNIDHLLPEPDSACVSRGGFFGDARNGPICNQQPRHQGLTPNHILVSLPTIPRDLLTSVSKSGGREIAFNQTMLIDGVWDVTIDPEEAYGTVNVNMRTHKPSTNVTASHNFGSRMLQRKTYEKASTDVGKAVGKDVAVMRDAAQSLQSKLSTEVGAGMSATKNMTTQLALYMARDLQVIGNKAVSLFGQLAEASNQTAAAFSKDFILVQRDLVKFTKDLSTKVKSKVESAKSSSKALIRSPLVLSRDRLLELKKAFANRKKVKSGSDASPCRRRSLKDHMKSFKSNKALSVVPESAPPSVTNNAEHVSQKAKLKKATQQLDALTKRVKRQGEDPGKKMPRTEFRKLKKDAKRQEKLVKKMRAEMQGGAP
ncbi:hypothetical protein M409DRAFT_59290 [Zasmidium cellare ATCC 36951]|uniref:Uncharacterized protein n=1 Tax=Zasmidium cellare ATCC 36951 TaxID=1080233 RepID=A0A6A6C5Y6_ZASCE|nr:uncharacterized protein M409DRAFT_59290 [Zasmidium cellare ATCC 36951]KAF2161292.1 hypothetical protein M409DRAFT_59290 [Zasmidium cellare ATCC 36951]